MEKTVGNNHAIKRRIHSIDITRGLIVFLSVIMFSIPQGIFSFDQHADWYGLTLVDFVLPCFITIFGTSMAIAYKNGVKKKRFFIRTIKLILFGLIFNMIAAWSIDLTFLRFTGVLQMFALLGIACVVITKYVKHPIKLILIGILILFIHGFSLLYIGNSCVEDLPQTNCNPSGIVDPLIFGENHIYAQGERGFDPEGIPAIFGALANVLFGFAAGQYLLMNKERGTGKKLILYAVLLVALGLIVSLIIPFGKRLWTPSFAFVTAGATTFMLALFHLLFDQQSSKGKGKLFKRLIQWGMVAFGRNSFLIYFGKYVVYSILINITIQKPEGILTINQLLYNWGEHFSTYPNLIYTLIISGFWTLVAVVCHRFKWYLKI